MIIFDGLINRRPCPKYFKFLRKILKFQQSKSLSYFFVQQTQHFYRTFPRHYGYNIAANGTRRDNVDIARKQLPLLNPHPNLISASPLAELRQEKQRMAMMAKLKKNVTLVTGESYMFIADLAW